MQPENTEMKKTYADQCLERSEKAAQGPWETYSNSESDYDDGIRVKRTQDDIITAYIPYEQSGVYGNENAIFIAHSRTDVPELARRLKRACQILREIHPHFSFASKTMNDLSDELEAIPKEDK